jgi:PEP-CTERM motif
MEIPGRRILRSKGGFGRMTNVTTSHVAARKKCSLRGDLDRRLSGYAVAACAAGVAALAQPARADIIYTPANQQLGTNNYLLIDLNHDGNWDFDIRNEVGSTTFGRSNVVFASAKPGAGGGLLAAALPSGARIGTGDPFSLVGFMATRWKTSYYGKGGSGGSWINVTNRYLGLEFEIDGRDHYGWARFNVTNGPDISIDAVLTGYAYNTVAGQQILAGQAPEPGTLGLLALGSLGLGLWRRRATAANPPRQ